MNTYEVVNNEGEPCTSDGGKMSNILKNVYTFIFYINLQVHAHRHNNYNNNNEMSIAMLQ